jgi:hypothetical protein
MSGEHRLDRLYPALTAKERGLLVLQAYKADEKPDRLIYDTTPDGQAKQFNHYIHLMNAANVEVAMVLMVLREQMAKVEMKLAWLQTLRFWADDVASLRVLVGLNTKEPITASEYAKREAEERAELLPLSECVQFVVEDHPWADADYVTDKDGERDVSTKAWSRVERATREHLKQCIADGTLPSRKRGRGLVIPAGAFYDWRGEPTPLYPEDAWEFDIRPDDQAEQVDLDRRAEAVVRRIFDRAPKPLPQPTDLLAAVARPGDGAGFGTELEQALVISICDLVRQHWCDARSLEVGVAEIAEEFDGEDPLRPDTRALLDGCLANCRKLRDDMADYAEFELPEPSEVDVAQVHRLIEKVAEA